MYRMLQAVEKQPIESSLSYDERTNVQSPAPTNYQQRDIYVRIFLILSWDYIMCIHVENLIVTFFLLHCYFYLIN
jgi:hypothetical protein